VIFISCDFQLCRKSNRATHSTYMR